MTQDPDGFTFSVSVRMADVDAAGVVFNAVSYTHLDGYKRQAVIMPRNRVTSVATGSVLKRVLLGRKMSSDRLHETLLPKKLALPIFASDALSSVAYAPDEILIMLGPVSYTHLDVYKRQTFWRSPPWVWSCCAGAPRSTRASGPRRASPGR